MKRDASIAISNAKRRLDSGGQHNYGAAARRVRCVLGIGMAHSYTAV